MRVVILATLIALLGGPAQTSSQIEGIVVRADTDAPIPHARIILLNQPAQTGEYATFSGEDGRFVLKNVPSGNYSLTAKDTGYLDAEYGAKRPKGRGTPMDVRAGQTIGDLQIRMTPGSVVSGRVFDQDGTPIPEARVQLIQPRYDPDGHRTAAVVSSVETNDRGEYRIFWLAPGNYQPVASVVERAMLLTPQQRSQHVIIHEQYDGAEAVLLPTFYPNSFDSAHATPIQVGAGIELGGIDFGMTRVPTVLVGGDVVDGETGAVAPRVSVTLRRKDEEWANLSQPLVVAADNRGQFELPHVPPGNYRLTAEVSRLPEGKRLTAETEIQVGTQNIAGLRLSLRPSGQDTEVNGHVEFEAGVIAQQVSIILKRVGALGGSGLMTVGKDRTFSGTVSSGLSGIGLAQIREGYFISSARSGSRDVLRDGVDSTGGSVDPIDVRIGFSSASIEGAVTDSVNDAVSGAQVILIPDADRGTRPDLFRTVTADQHGHFSIHGVTPGDYKLFAWEDLEPFSYFDPVFLAPFEPIGSAIHVERAGTSTVTLHVIR